MLVHYVGVMNILTNLFKFHAKRNDIGDKHDKFIIDMIKKYNIEYIEDKTPDGEDMVRVAGRDWIIVARH